MEQKKVTYMGADTQDVTEQLEAGNEKMAAKGWREYRVDMLSSSTVRVTYVRGDFTSFKRKIPDGRGRLPLHRRRGTVTETPCPQGERSQRWSLD